MKRNPALVSLSRDHHQALVVAQKLRRATAETAVEARVLGLEFWERDGRGHFRLEEEVLLPAFAAHGDPMDPRVARVLCEHVAIRQRMSALAADASSPAEKLNELGALLAGHVRFEERELFPLIESVMPAADLSAVAAALSPTEGAPDG
jgi:hemerythrin HHE cation binding domain-containing protein